MSHARPSTPITRPPPSARTRRASSPTGSSSPPARSPSTPATGQVVAGDVVAQTEQVFRNLAAILDATGAELAGRREGDRVPHRHADFPRVNEVYARVMGDARPARSTVQVAGLPRGVLVEIDLVAVVPPR